MDHVFVVHFPPLFFPFFIGCGEKEVKVQVKEEIERDKGIILSFLELRLLSHRTR